MFNLLPDNLKGKIKTEYQIRRLTVFLTFVIFLQISFLIFLSPSWVASVFRQEEAVSQIEKMRESLLSQNTNSVASIIAGTNAKLNIINTTLEYPEVAPIFNVILSNQTSSIRLNGLTYTSINASTSALTMSGISTTRESLVSFVKSLEKSKAFKTVDLPVSNLAKDKNIDFAVSLIVGQ